jgi:pimeloyl-ACP methyl ester carboxylesterase
MGYGSGMTNLYHEVLGSGPVLLIAQSGEGDAGRTADLVKQLIGEYTVITYDRRGLSRSPVDTAPTMADHADDVHRLLTEVTDEPVAMLGCSIGAVIGLHLAARHPGQVHTLIAHEPVAPWLLPTDERGHHERELLDIQVIYRTHGLAAAAKEIGRVLGIDPSNQDTEPDVRPQPMTPQRVDNFDFFIRNDFTAIVNDDLEPADIAALTDTRIVPVVGTTTPRRIFDRRCAQELATLLGADLVEFPGGHNGNTTHPRAYAARLRQVLRHALASLGEQDGRKAM